MRAVHLCQAVAKAVAKSYYNMANVYDSQGKYDEAMEYYQKSLSINLTIHGRYGDKHPGRGCVVQ